jgi:hypothetical protein
MEKIDDSLNAQHLRLARQLEAVIAACRAGRWGEYRLRFGALREGLMQHMAFEHDALYPILEQGAAAAVKKLRDEHSSLRSRLEMLGAAAPDQDPEGCLAELGELAALLRSHHAAEMALDPQYATRPVPRLELGEPPPMDLRGLQPPEPIVRILQALERDPGATLRVILPHEPVPLYALLRERGFSWSGAVRADGSYELAISRA